MSFKHNMCDVCSTIVVQSCTTQAKRVLSKCLVNSAMVQCNRSTQIYA